MDEARTREIVREEIAAAKGAPSSVIVDVSGDLFAPVQIRALIEQINQAVAEGATLRTRNS
jgi:hypothetical protein